MADSVHIFRHHAMATFFEMRVAGGGDAYAGQAAQAAFAIIDRTEMRLSRFLEGSEISQINRLQPGEVLRVSVEVAACLAQAIELQALTHGAFDPGLGGPPTALLQRVGDNAFHRGQLLIDNESLLVGVEGGPVSLDLGAIGKGFALDLAAEELRDWELPRTLLNGGGSSLLSFTGPGAGLDKQWEIGIGGDRPTHRLFLENNALGSSGTAVKGEHILDPDTGKPVPSGRRTWAIAPTAAAADALSTAWMILPLDEIETICAERQGIGAIVQSDGKYWSTGLAPELHFGVKSRAS